MSFVVYFVVYKIAIVAGAFHRKEVETMLEESRRVANDNGLEIAKIVWVPGSIEKPLALKRLLLSDKIDGAVVLGIIEKGETKHGLVLGQAVIKSIIDLQLQTMKPVGVGILGPEIEQHQINQRLIPYARGAVLAVMSMLDSQSSQK